MRRRWILECDERGTVETEQLVCERDGVPTRLSCTGCNAGICPACLVRTPVGNKCPNCAGEAAAPRRSRGSRVGLAVAVVLGLAAVVFGAGLLGSSDGTTASDPVAVETSVGEAAATRQSMMGEEARDGQFVFVVEDFGCQPRTAPDGGAGPPGKRCTLRFNVKNISNSPATMLGRFQYLVDGQRRTYGADDALTRAVPENASRSVTDLNINPGVVIPWVFVYDLPDNVEPTEAQFRGTGRSRFGITVRLQRRA